MIPCSHYLWRLLPGVNSYYCYYCWWTQIPHPTIDSSINQFAFGLRARLVDYLFPMSKVLKIRVGRSGKKKEGRSTYNRVSNFFICDRNAANAMARSTNMCTWCSWDTFPSVSFFSLFIQKIVQIWKMLNSQAQIIQTFFYLFHSKCSYQKKKSSSGQDRSESKKKNLFF